MVACPVVTGCPQAAYCRGASRSGGQRKRRHIHAELRIDEHVELVSPYGRCHDRRTGPAAAELAKGVGTPRDLALPPRPCRERDGRRSTSNRSRSRSEIQLLKYRPQVPTWKNADGEADADASPRQRSPADRCKPLRRNGANRARGQRRVACLQRPVVAALIGKKEVRPAQPVENLRLPTSPPAPR